MDGEWQIKLGGQQLVNGCDECDKDDQLVKNIFKAISRSEYPIASILIPYTITCTGKHRA